ncbi:MAG: AraC family transcriptional regulator [Ahrensia sp.]|nr:AraC family transcriptional regulator [Ahrensia sp.]
MSEVSKRSNTINFIERKASSAAFRKLYADGMGLVEETAAYLDGEGRTEAKKLSRISATLYAAESMRLTTRLMQIASWLLLQRALNSGEMSREQMMSEKKKIRLDTSSAKVSTNGWEELPEAFRLLVKRSLRLQAYVQRLDQDLFGELVAAPMPAMSNDNPVGSQIELLRTAFAAR